MKFAGGTEVDIYAVGWLAVLLGLGRSIRSRHGGAIRHALGRIRWEWRYTIEQARAGDWRAVRNAFNGYLAEHPDAATNCGRGWTKRAALRRLMAIRAREILA